MFKSLSSYASAATIGLTLTLSCASSIGQDSVTDERRRTPEVASRTDDDGFNYGWLGLGGLLGLLGLMPRRAPQTAFTVRDGAGNVKQQSRT